MKKIAVIAFIVFAAATSASAQKKLHPKPKVYEFADKPSVHPVPPEYKKEPAIILLRDVVIDYKFEGRNTNMYYTEHMLVKVLDEKGIESFNTIGIPVSRQTRVPLIKARSISPSGKVMDVAKDMIKVTKDEYGRNKIVIAMEGVERNSEIELLIKEIKPFAAFGSEYFQYSVPVLEGHLSISYPRDFVFEEKGYNGFPDAKDTLLNNRRHIDIWVSDVPALEREPYSFYDIHRMRAEYRIHHRTDENHNDFSALNTWDELGRHIYDYNYTFTDKERAAVNKFLTDIGVHAKGDEEENIKKIEQGIKNTIIQYSYVQNDSADVLDTIIASKAATAHGYLRLFAACLTQAEVKHELGMAGDHSEYKLDRNFINWNNFDYSVFYFPNQRKFLYPLSVFYRYPVVPVAIVNSKGVFCTIPPKGVITGELAAIRIITPLSANESAENVAMGVSFTEDMETMVDVSYAYTGYTGIELRRAILTENKDEELDLVKSVVKFAEKKEDIVKYTISNEGVENYNSNKPLEITATVNTPLLVSKAGNKYLFSIGALIGEQIQLYNEKKRVMPVDIAYPSSQKHTITVNIPKGYKLLNPEVLKKHAEYVNRNMKSLISFNADYTIITDKKNGDKLVVTLDEYYPQTHFPVADWPRFRDVVNAAADFDKVVLVLEKKGGGGAKPKAKAVASR